MFPHKRVVYETCSCACSQNKRLGSAHLLTYEIMFTCKIQHITLFLYLTSNWYTWNDLKPHDFNLRTILRMQLLKYETTSENISLTDAKTMMRDHCKKTSLYATFRLTWASQCQSFTRRTCLYATFYVIRMFNLDRHVSTQICRLRDVFMRVFTH